MSPVWANRAPAAANPILTLAHNGKRFAGVHALQDVSIELRGQEIHALVGENGAGKSTLIKIAGGNLRPDSGQIEFRGKEISLYSPAHARALGISVIHQELT